MDVYAFFTQEEPYGRCEKEIHITPKRRVGRSSRLGDAKNDAESLGKTKVFGFLYARAAIAP